MEPGITTWHFDVTGLQNCLLGETPVMLTTIGPLMVKDLGCFLKKKKQKSYHMSIVSKK